jgi:hypothetical protein
MKKLFLMGFASAITLFAAVGSANAVVIDFTDASLVPSGTTLNGSAGGISWTLTAVSGGNLNNTENQNGSTCGSLGLLCQRDGIGIGDDEITSISTSSGQVLQLTFTSGPVNVSQLMFLDLFSPEEAFVGTDGTNYPFQFLGLEASGVGLSGQLSADTTGIAQLQNITTIYFTAWLPHVDDNTNDYALAGLNVTAVPEPPTLALLGAALLAFAYLRFRKGKAA